MATDARSDQVPEPTIEGTGRRVGMVCARFNSHVTLRLLDGAIRALADAGVADGDMDLVWVPGAFEIPLAAKTMASSGKVDGVVCLGAVIRGETSHYDFVAGQCAEGIQLAQLDTGIPIAFGVLTTEDLEQALARSEGAGGHNVGHEAATVVLEMATVLDGLRGR